MYTNMLSWSHAKGKFVRIYTWTKDISIHPWMDLKYYGKTSIHPFTFLITTVIHEHSWLYQYQWKAFHKFQHWVDLDRGGYFLAWKIGRHLLAKDLLTGRVQWPDGLLTWYIDLMIANEDRRSVHMYVYYPSFCLSILNCNILNPEGQVWQWEI